MSANRLNNNGDSYLIDKFIKDLESTSEQVQKLLDNVRASEKDFAAIKIELKILCENVKDLSLLLRDGDGRTSIITRMAIFEEKIKDLEKDLEKSFFSKEEMSKERASLVSLISTNKEVDKEIQLVDKNGSWQLKLAMGSGIIALLTTIINLIAQHFK